MNLLGRFHRILLSAIIYVKKYMIQCELFFTKNQDAISISNWKLLRKMTVVYLGFLFAYYFIMCVIMEKQQQVILVFWAILIHFVYTGIVWAHKNPPKSNKTIDNYILLFGLMILIPSLLIGTVISTEHASLFPLVLIMMGQIYTLSPVRIYILDLISTIIFILLSFHLKEEVLFYQDLVSVLVADIITFICSDTIMRHRLEENSKQDHLEQLTLIDTMTGLYNKNAFENLYNQFYMNSHAGYYALAVIDMDGVKQINDANGYQFGDEVIITFAKLIQQVFSDEKNNVIGRIDGDEFAVLLRNQQDSRMIQQQFDHLIELSNEMGNDKFGVPIKCSIGVKAQKFLPQTFTSCFSTCNKEIENIKKNGGNYCKVVC